MNFIRMKELKGELGNMGLAYLIVIVLVIIVFLFRGEIFDPEIGGADETQVEQAFNSQQ